MLQQVWAVQSSKEYSLRLAMRMAGQSNVIYQQTGTTKAHDRGENERKRARRLGAEAPPQAVAAPERRAGCCDDLKD